MIFEYLVKRETLFGERRLHMLISRWLAAVGRPVPIPNTDVKRSMADGSGCIASARVGCRRDFFWPIRKPNPKCFRGKKSVFIGPLSAE